MDKKLLILDGGLGTTLEDGYNIKFSLSTPLWSSHLLISDPETLTKVQKDFAAADIILTPTYQASHGGFRKTIPDVTDDQIEKYMRSGIEISRSATDGLVALSLGAYGAILQPSQEYSGDYGGMDEDGLLQFHRERISVFDLSTVDLIAFETLPRLDEIRAVKKVVDGSKPYWISCVFPEGNVLPDGSTMYEVLRAMMEGNRPWGVGMNCTKIQKVSALIKEFEEAAIELKIVLPRLVLYPDGTNGQVYDTSKQVWVGEESDDGPWHQKMYEIVKNVIDRDMWEGVVVGGCCKTTPQHIRQLRQSLSSLGVL